MAPIAAAVATVGSFLMNPVVDAAGTAIAGYTTMNTDSQNAKALEGQTMDDQTAAYNKQLEEQTEEQTKMLNNQAMDLNYNMFGGNPTATGSGVGSPLDDLFGGFGGLQ